MEKTILQNGTRVISYAPDDECNNELGTITSSLNIMVKYTMIFTSIIMRKVVRTLI